MLKNYFKIAWRILSKNKIYALLNLAGLSIGLTAVMLIVLYVKDELSFDRFHEKAGNIYRVVHESRDPTGKEGGGGNSGAIEGPTFLKEIPEVKDFCRVLSAGETLVKVNNEVMSEPVMLADTSFFRLFSFPLVAGNPSTALNGINSVVLSEDLARKYFHSVDVVGKILEINQDGNFLPFVITGVTKRTPTNSSIQLNMLISIEKYVQQPWTQEWLASFLNTFVLLRDDADLPAINKKMERIFDKYVGERFAVFKQKFGNSIYYRYRLQALEKMHTDSYYNLGNGLSAGSNIAYSYILGGIAAFILLIASINFINLTLARSFRRSKEIGIRKVNGGNRRQLILQFLGESLLLNTFAVVLASVLVYCLLPVFSELTNKKLAITYLFTGEHLLLFFLLFLLNTLLSGCYPAFVLASFRPVQVLYGKIKLSSKQYLGRTLIVLQFTIAIFLMIGMVVMQKQFHYLIYENPGYQTANIIDLQIPTGETSVEPLKSALLQFPFIKHVGGQSISFTDFNNTMIEVDKKEVYDVAFFKMDDQVLSMLQVPFLAGRNFNGAPADSLSCIVNESLAKSMAWEDPIGKKIKWQDRELNIVGMVKDFHVSSFKEKMHPVFIHQVPSWGVGHLMVNIDPEHIQEAVASIQKVYKKYIPLYPCHYSFLDNMLKSQYESEERWKNIISIAASLSIAIACLGLFGLASLSTEQRKKEIGIRKVLGANLSSILNTLSYTFIKLIIVAILLAAPLAWWATNEWLRDFAYKAPISIWLYLVTTGITVLIAYLTIATQTFRAAQQNPVDSLRNE